MPVGRQRNRWTPGEDQALRKAVHAVGKGKPNWAAIAKHIPGRTSKDCRKRWAHGLNQNLSRGCWSPSEDARLKEAVQMHGPHWALVATKVGARTSDQCAKRWSDVLDPSLNRSEWTPQEDILLLDLYQQLGTSWAKVATHIPGRSPLHCRNRACKLFVDRREPRPGSAGAEELRLSRLANQQLANSNSNNSSSTSSPSCGSVSTLPSSHHTDPKHTPTPTQLVAQAQTLQQPKFDEAQVHALAPPSPRGPLSESIQNFGCDISSWLAGSPFETSYDMIPSPAGSHSPINEASIPSNATDIRDQLYSLLTSTLTTEPEAPFQLDPLLDSTVPDASFSQDLLGLMDGSSDQDNVYLSKCVSEQVLNFESGPQPTSSTRAAEPWTQLLSPAGGTDPTVQQAGLATCMPTTTDQAPHSTNQFDQTHQASLPHVGFPTATRRLSMPALGLVMTMADDPARVLRTLAAEPDSRLCQRRNPTSVDGDFVTAFGARTTARSANWDSSPNTSSSSGFCSTPEDINLLTRMHALQAAARASSNGVGTAHVVPIQAACQLLQQSKDAQTMLPFYSAYSGSPHLEGQGTNNDLSHLVRNMADLLASMATLTRAISSANGSKTNGV